MGLGHDEQDRSAETSCRAGLLVKTFDVMLIIVAGGSPVLVKTFDVISIDFHYFFIVDYCGRLEPSSGRLTWAASLKAKMQFSSSLNRSHSSQGPHLTSRSMLDRGKVNFPSLYYDNAVQVDLVKQLVSYYPNDLVWATTADEIEKGFASGDGDDDREEDDNTFEK